MIIQALKECYDRKAASPDSDIAPFGREYKDIPYIIVLDKMGNVVDVQCTYEGIGKQRRAKKFLVPQTVKRTVGIKSNLLWDNIDYVLGIPQQKKTGQRPSSADLKLAAAKHMAFKERIILLATDDDAIVAIRKFLDHDSDELRFFLEKYDAWLPLLEEGPNISFKLLGDSQLVTERIAVQDAITKQASTNNEPIGRCLITGEEDSIGILHPVIKGVWGGNPTGTNIVGFNLPSSESFGKKQGYNAPIGQKTVFAYTTALNLLLDKDSKNRIQVGDASTVFWAEKPNTLEDDFGVFFGEPPKDDPDRGVRAVAALFESIKTGAFTKEENQTRFYVLGLSPNAARIAIRFWICSSVKDMAINIAQHFHDTEIVHSPSLQDTLSIFRFLVSVALQGKSENIPANLENDFMRAILQGHPYSLALLQAVIKRIRAEHDVTYARAALIKACINRRTRYTNPDIKEELKVSLDLQNTNIGYRLGRLFAALEKIQSEANPGINATIRDRYYGAASGTPVVVFPNLMRLKNHHLAKYESTGLRINREQLLAEIISEVVDFPAHLTLADQGCFAIGYYHQMQNFYTKKSETEK